MMHPIGWLIIAALAGSNAAPSEDKLEVFILLLFILIVLFAAVDVAMAVIEKAFIRKRNSSPRT